MDKHHWANRKRGKETLQKPCRAKILKHWIWKGELEAFTTGETKSFQESYVRVLLVSGSAGADPLHFSRTGRDDFPSGKYLFLASSHLNICMERNRRSVIAGATLLQDTEISACQPAFLHLRFGRDDQGLSGIRLLY